MGIFKKAKKLVGGVAKMSLGLVGGLTGGLLGGQKLPKAEDVPAPVAAAAKAPDTDVAMREQDMRRAMTASGSDYASLLGGEEGELDDEGKPKKRLRAARELLG